MQGSPLLYLISKNNAHSRINLEKQNKKQKTLQVIQASLPRGSHPFSKVALEPFPKPGPRACSPRVPLLCARVEPGGSGQINPRGRDGVCPNPKFFPALSFPEDPCKVISRER